MPAIGALNSICRLYSNLWEQSLDTSGSCLPIIPPSDSISISKIEHHLNDENDKFFTFIEVEDLGLNLTDDSPECTYDDIKPIEKLLAETVNTAQDTFAKKEMPSVSIILEKLNAYNIGQLIYMIQVATTICADLTVEKNKEHTILNLDKNNDKDPKYIV